MRTALRTIEIVRADVGDIRQESGEPVLWIRGKGHESKDDFVVLTESTLKPILEYLQTRGNVKDDEPLFVSLSDRNQNGRLTTRSISRIVKNHLKRIGLNSKRLTAHSLRHGGLTALLSHGNGNIQEAQILGRHADINVTQIYLHNIERVKNAPEKKLGKAIDDVLGNGKSVEDKAQGGL
jgi:integrase/recombinase XerC/integrase/recombinase XerD